MTTQKLRHWNLECEINLAGIAKSIGVTSGVTKAGSAASDRTRRQKKKGRGENDSSRLQKKLPPDGPLFTASHSHLALASG